MGKELFQASEAELVKLRGKIGYIFQAHNLLPFMTAQQNVQMSLELDRGLSGDRVISRNYKLDKVQLRLPVGIISI